MRLWKEKLYLPVNFDEWRAKDVEYKVPNRNIKRMVYMKESR